MLRRFPIGAEIDSTGVHFRVWAPNCKTVDIILINKNIYALEPERDGYFSGFIKEAVPGDHYLFCLDKDENRVFPDPASRFQPEGPHGPSEIVDPNLFKWSDHQWPGIVQKDKVILYELHVGTFTPEGTWQSASKKIPYLAELGITVIEMMPVNEFCGDFNWGYDGINLFAPTRCYGSPDDLRAFIDLAHAHGIGVILDIVYNHFGPDGNYLHEFSKSYFKRKKTDWGRAINFDGPQNQEVRSYFITNAKYWISEFHFDGMRFDAVHAIKDNSTNHILAEISSAVRDEVKPKSLYLTAENEQQSVHVFESTAKGGFGMDAIWNEDFHHTALVRLTGHNEGYYHDYTGEPQEFVSSLKYGFLYQGQWYDWQKKRRGSLSRYARFSNLIQFIENHDQIANSPGSSRVRLLSQPGAYRALTTLLLLAPQIPLIFQGQEFGATTPFNYFSQQNEKISKKAHEGRLEFLSQFPSFRDPGIKRKIPLPQNPETFFQSKIDWKEKEINQPIFQLFKDLIALRKNDELFRQLDHAKVDGSIINHDAFLIHYQIDAEERLLIFNFGIDLALTPLPDPLFAPPKNCEWEILWSSEDSCYNGIGRDPSLKFEKDLRITGNSALIFRPKELKQ